MNIKSVSKLGVLALAFCSWQAMAQTGPKITVGSGSGQVGSATPVTVNVAYDGDGTVAAFQVDVTYDTANLTADLSSCGGPLGGANFTCTDIGPGAIRFLGDDAQLNPLPSGSLGSIAFDISAAPIGDYDLLVPAADEIYSNNVGENVPSTGSVPGLVQVTSGPQPLFTGTPAGLAMTTEQGLADPTGTLTVTNTGEAASLLTGTCTLMGTGAPQITMSNGAFTDIAVGAAGSVVGVACDSAAAGSYSDTLSCTHNGSNASPATFPVTCEITPPGAALYTSNPAPGATIEMTPNGDVPAGTSVPDQVLTITNGATDANDNDLALINCGWTGSAEITATAPASPLAPLASTMVTFSCDSASVGAYTGTYSCDYDTDADGSSDGTASYTVNCGVRTASSDIQETPTSGTEITFVAPIGGTGGAAVRFDEVLDEGVDATVDSCNFGTADFAVVTPLPGTVTAGGSLEVVISGTDPGTGTKIFTDMLICAYTDSDSDPGTASWPVTMVVANPVPIPTLSTWGLLFMILTVMGFGGIVVRRKVQS